MIHDQDGRLKRIEYRGKYLREAEPAVSLRAQTKLAGLNLTANAQHGFRVSTRVAKGTNVGFQNGRFVLRGRYGKGRTKLNLSKSGVSFVQTSVGTINWFKPRHQREIAGVRCAEDALYINILASLIQMAFVLLLAAVQLIAWLAGRRWGIAWRLRARRRGGSNGESIGCGGRDRMGRTLVRRESTGLFRNGPHHVSPRGRPRLRNANEDGFLDALFTDEWAAVLEGMATPNGSAPSSGARSSASIALERGLPTSLLGNRLRNSGFAVHPQRFGTHCAGRILVFRRRHRHQRHPHATPRNAPRRLCPHSGIVAEPSERLRPR